MKYRKIGKKLLCFFQSANGNNKKETPHTRTILIIALQLFDVARVALCINHYKYVTTLFDVHTINKQNF